MNQPRKKAVVLGAGVTGLAAAYRLSKNKKIDVTVVEKEAITGGVCRSFQDGEFILDHGPHKFYTLIDGLTDELHQIMGPDLLERDKTQSLYMKGRYFDFPLKLSEMILKFPPLESLSILSSFGVQTIKNFFPHPTAKTYEDFIVERFGRGLYEQIFAPMARKIYGAPEKLDRKLAEVRISSPGLISVVKQLLFRNKIDKSISAPKFHYPKYGYGMIPQRLEEKCRENGVQFALGSKIKDIRMSPTGTKHIGIETNKKELLDLKADYLIYTIPMSLLDDLMGDQLSTDIRQASRFTSYRHTVIFYYLLRGEAVLPSMWVFFPESKFRFGRLSEMPKFSPFTTPKGHTSLMVDFTCDDSDPAWAMDDARLGQLLMEHLKPLRLFQPEQVIKSFSKRFKYFYPVYNVGFQEKLSALRKIESIYPHFYFIGRLGDFNYNNADQCLDMGFKCAEQILSEAGVSESWNSVRETRFDRYKIVD